MKRKRGEKKGRMGKGKEKGRGRERARESGAAEQEHGQERSDIVLSVKWFSRVIGALA